MTKVIALLGGPGVGKSTVATGVFSALKQHKIRCELVTEYAKEVVWDEATKLLDNQIHIFSEQFRRQFRLLNKVPYIVTDSPLFLSSIYLDITTEKLKDHPLFDQDYVRLMRTFFDESFLRFDNIVYFLTRVKAYDTVGRTQTFEESKAIDERILDKLESMFVRFTYLEGTDGDNIRHIVNEVLHKEGVLV